MVTSAALPEFRCRPREYYSPLSQRRPIDEFLERHVQAAVTPFGNQSNHGQRVEAEFEEVVILRQDPAIQLQSGLDLARQMIARRMGSRLADVRTHSQPP